MALGLMLDRFGWNTISSNGKMTGLAPLQWRFLNEYVTGTYQEKPVKEEEKDGD